MEQQGRGPWVRAAGQVTCSRAGLLIRELPCKVRRAGLGQAGEEEGSVKGGPPTQRDAFRPGACVSQAPKTRTHGKVRSEHLPGRPRAGEGTGGNATGTWGGRGHKGFLEEAGSRWTLRDVRDPKESRRGRRRGDWRRHQNQHSTLPGQAGHPSPPWCRAGWAGKAIWSEAEKGQGGGSELRPPVSPLSMGTAAFALRELEKLGQGRFWHQGASFQGTSRESLKTFS